jgi:hypothetical protein
MLILSAILEFLFISSIIFIIYIIGNLIIKMYGKFKLGENVTFVLTTFEKIVLWLSLSMFFSYII